MKKLLALLLLSPLAFAEQSSVLNDGTNTLDLESLSQFFPNDSYVGLTCSNEKDKRHNDIEYVKKKGRFWLQYRMHAFSIKDNQGATLIEASFGNCNFCKEKKRGYNIKIKDKFAGIEVSDWSVKINDRYMGERINRTTLKSDLPYGIQCEISSQEQMKDFGYKIAKKIQEYEKIKKDREEARLNERKF